MTPGTPSIDFSPAFAALEAKNFWFSNRRELFIWALKEYAPLAQNFLDIGCGLGFVLEGIEKKLPALRLEGCDLSETNLQFAGARINKASFFRKDITTIDSENRYDAVGAFDVLEHVEEDVEALRRCYRALRPGGKLIVSVPQHPSLWSYFDEASNHVRRYDKSDLLSKMRQVGFRPVRSTSFMTLLLPLLETVRKRKPKSTQASSAVLAELHIHPLANVLLGWVCCLERKIIRLGISLTSGGSLLVVAEK